jgi:hypothetical protein
MTGGSYEQKTRDMDKSLGFEAFNPRISMLLACC